MLALFEVSKYARRERPILRIRNECYTYITCNTRVATRPETTKWIDMHVYIYIYNTFARARKQNFLYMKYSVFMYLTTIIAIVSYMYARF